MLSRVLRFSILVVRNTFVVSFVSLSTCASRGLVAETFTARRQRRHLFSRHPYQVPENDEKSVCQKIATDIYAEEVPTAFNSKPRTQKECPCRFVSVLLS